MIDLTLSKKAFEEARKYMPGGVNSSFYRLRKGSTYY